MWLKLLAKKGISKSVKDIYKNLTATRHMLEEMLRSALSSGIKVCSL